jgi:predicted transcriptional regulator
MSEPAKSIPKSHVRKRNQLKIKYEILSMLAQQQMPAGELSRKIGTHFYTTRNALTALLKKGLVERDYHEYKITEKGRQTLPVLKKVIELYDEIDQLLSTIDV